MLFNGLSPVGLFLSIGVFYVLSGTYFGMTVPVQPMKVIGAYAIATAMTAEQILAAFQGIAVDEIQKGAEAYEIDVRMADRDKNSHPYIYCLNVLL